MKENANTNPKIDTIFSISSNLHYFGLAKNLTKWKCLERLKIVDFKNSHPFILLLFCLNSEQASYLHLGCWGKYVFSVILRLKSII